MQKSLVLLTLICALIVGFLYVLQNEIVLSGSGPLHLRVTFLDVGQGDATFIEAPDGTQVLIDGGRGDNAVLRELPSVMGPFDRQIDLVVATHGDADHIGGLVDVLERYEVKRILITDNVNDTPVYDAFMRAVKEEHTEVVYAARGQAFDLGRGEAGSTTLTILFPDRSVRTLESNMSSIVARLSYGEADVLLTGDSPEAIETHLVERERTSLQSEVLKLGHHGSRTSSSPRFVGHVLPQVGIISAGKDNEYGHPHREVIDVMEQHGVITKNTADLGSIFMESDGRSIWFR